jgi:glycosyltransferase involved in cell wall biosynthesis
MKSATKTVLSIVLPALNEEEAIGGTIEAIPAGELSEMGYEVEILVVDNGSTDRTAEVARRHGAEVIHESRRGYGRAYKTGFKHARGDVIATIDADMTYPVEDIPKLVNTLEEEDLDFITTNRFAYLRNGAMSLQHRLGNNILTLTTRLLFRINLKDSQSGMWVFRKSLLPKMTLKSDSMAFSQELKVEACHFTGCRWREIPIEYRARVGRVKLRTLRDGFGNLFRLVIKRVARHDLPATASAPFIRVARIGMSWVDKMSP